MLKQNLIIGILFILLQGSIFAITAKDIDCSNNCKCWINIGDSNILNEIEKILD